MKKSKKPKVIHCGPMEESDRVLGLDAASSTGWCVMHPKGAVIEVGHEKFAPPKTGRKTIPDDHPGGRFQQLHIFLRAVIQKHGITHIAYEEPGGGAGRYALLLEAGMRGVIYCLAAFYQIRIYSIAPGTLKKYATGNGHADKEEMSIVLGGCHEIYLNQDDEVDAAWLALWLIDLSTASHTPDAEA